MGWDAASAPEKGAALPLDLDVARLALERK
jgi:hypothetical protein